MNRESPSWLVIGHPAIRPDPGLDRSPARHAGLPLEGLCLRVHWPRLGDVMIGNANCAQQIDDATGREAGVR